MINLLPTALRKKARQDYLLRLTAVICFAATFVIFIGSGFLIPTYFKINATREILEGSVRTINSTLSQFMLNTKPDSGEAIIYSLMNERKSKARPSKLIYDILNERMPGIIITGIEYDVNEKTMVNMSGVASAREDLLTFKQRIESIVGVERFELPANILTKSTNIHFSAKVEYKRLVL